MSEPIIRVVGRFQFTANIGVGANVDSLQLSDQISTQLSSLSDMYGLYRFTHLRVHLPAGVQTNSSTAPSTYGVAFTPEALLVIPTTLAEAIQLPFWCGHALYITTGSNVLINGSTDHQGFTVPRKDLMRVGVKWFRTQGRGTETDWEIQGTFLFACHVAPATTALVFRGWCEYNVEFTDQLPLAATRERILDDFLKEGRCTSWADASCTAMAPRLLPAPKQVDRRAPVRKAAAVAPPKRNRRRGRGH